MPLQQLGWFYDAVPAQLPVWLLVGGLELLILGALVNLHGTTPALSNMRPSDRLLGLSALGAGYFFTALSVVESSYGAYAAFLFVLFRAVEGAAGLQFYYRLVTVIRGGTGSSTTGGGSFVLYRLTTFFLVLVGVGLLLATVLPGRSAPGLVAPFDPRFVYTVTSLLIAVLGVYSRMRPLASAYHGATVAGMALGVAGAELYNYRTLATEVTVTLAGGLAYAVGFWVVVALWQFGLAGPFASGGGRGHGHSP